MSSDEFEDNPLERLPVKMKKLSSDRLPMKPVFKSAKVIGTSDIELKGKENMKIKKKLKNIIPSFSASMDKSYAAINKVNLIPEGSDCGSVQKGEKPKESYVEANENERMKVR